MATIAEMVVKIGAKTDEFNRQIAKAQATVQNFSRGVSKAGNIATLGLTAPLALVGKKALEMGMDAVESENLFSVAMGDMADSATEWSKALSKAVGVNEFELRKNVGTLNNMLKNMTGNTDAAYDMSKALVELSHDMASFYNITQEDALAKLQSGITGEAEPLKRLGILLNESTVKQFAYSQGIARQGEKLTETQKVMARYAAILAQTTDAQGDMARTMDSPANRLRVLKERFTQLQIEIGMKMIPVLINFLDTIDPVVNAITSMSDAQLQLTLNIGAFLFALGPALKVLGALGTVLSFVFTPLGLLLTAIGIAAAIFIDWSKAGSFLVESFESLKAWIMGDGIKMFWEFVENAREAFNGFVEFITPIWDSFVLFLLELWEQYSPSILASFKTIFDSINNVVVTIVDFVKKVWEGFANFIIDIWTKYGSTIIETVATVFTVILDVIAVIIETVSRIITTTLDFILEFWETNGKAIIETVSLIFNTIIKIATPILEFLVEVVMFALKAIGDIFENGFKFIMSALGVFVNLFTGNWDAMFENIQNIIDSGTKIVLSIIEFLVNTILEAFVTLAKLLGAVIGAVFKGIATVIMNIVNFVIDGINTAIRAFNSFVKNVKIPDWLAELTGISTGGKFTINELSRIDSALPTTDITNQPQQQKIEVYLDGAKISEAVDRRLGAAVALGAF